MEKIQQIKEKLDEALSRISLPLYHWHQPENFFTDKRTETRILIQEALALIDEMEKEKRDNWPKRRMEIMSTRIKD